MSDYAVIEFDVNDVSTLSRPYFQGHKGYIDGGLTGGGAREYHMSNKFLSELENFSIRKVYINE